MAEVHDRYVPERRHDAHRASGPEPVRAAEFDREVAKAVEANRAQDDSESEKATDRRPGILLSAPDKREHGPDRPAQEHPDVSAPYGPDGEIARHYGDRDSPARTDQKSRTEALFDDLTENAEDVGDRIQRTVDRVSHLLDPARPPLSKTSTHVGLPKDRPTMSPQLKETPHDVVSNAVITAIFVAEATRRTAALVRSAVAHRRDESS